MQCFLPHIPARLHTAGRPHIPYFREGEHIYRRTKYTDLENPFSSVSPLMDVSVNREGICTTAPLCEPADVLLNFNPEKEGTHHSGCVCVTLEMVRLTEPGIWKMESPEEISKENRCVLELRHDEEVCNYAHSVFEVFLNGDLVKEENYKQGLGKQKNLRTWVKKILADLVVNNLSREDIGK